MQQEKGALDNRMDAERQQELDACKTTGYEKRYGEVPDVLIGMDVISSGLFTVDSIGDETILTFEPDF